MRKIDTAQFDTLEKRLAHIESLLQRMPEMIATAFFIENEHAESAFLVGKKYSETVELNKPIQR